MRLVFRSFVLKTQEALAELVEWDPHLAVLIEKTADVHKSFVSIRQGPLDLMINFELFQFLEDVVANQLFSSQNVDHSLSDALNIWGIVLADLQKLSLGSLAIDDSRVDQFDLSIKYELAHLVDDHNSGNTFGSVPSALLHVGLNIESQSISQGINVLGLLVQEIHELLFGIFEKVESLTVLTQDMSLGYLKLLYGLGFLVEDFKSEGLLSE